MGAAFRPLLLIAALEPLLDELLYIGMPNFSQASDTNGGDSSRGEKLVRVGATKPEVLAHLVGAHQIFSWFGLCVWEHPDTFHVGSFTTATLRCRGRVPVRFGLFRLVISRLYPIALVSRRRPRCVPGPNGPIFSLRTKMIQGGTRESSTNSRPAFLLAWRYHLVATTVRVGILP